LRDAQPAAALASADLVRALGPLADRDPAWTSVARLATDTVGADMAGRWRPVPLEPDDVAFLQYTSGSTSLPRGVVVSHANLMHNQRALHDAFAQSADSVIVGWLPLYHDMGLIGNVLHTLYLGASCVLMPPLAFLQRPVRWLRAISRFRATVSGGPNFAYDLCARRVDADDRRDFDLSSWAVAFNGAEPVQAATIERFSAAFAGCGFTRGAFQPCYGLAEATLMVTASRRDDRPTIRRVRRDALEAGRAIDADDGDGDRARALVSCGTPDPTHQIAIVDPVTGGRTPEGYVGEIWVAGPGVARGYWANPEETDRVFGASCGDTAGFLRTGDLGTLRDGELYVTGRLKDLVILRGRNLDPHDLESTVERSHAALRAGCGVACSIEVGGEERLVIVHEVRERLASGELEAVCQDIQRSLVQAHDVDPYAIALVAAGRVPKTSSGKLQRRLCRAQFVENRLEPLFTWTSPAPAAQIADDREAADSDRAGAPAADERDAVRTALVGLLSRIGRVPASRIDRGASIAALGFDSLRAAELQGEIERTFGARVQQAALLEAPTVDAIVTLILDEGRLPPPGPPAGQTSDAPASTGERLSHGQRALWFLQQMAPESAAYHIARAGRVRGRLHASSLERALRSLVERHVALRAGFDTVDGEPVQRLQPAAVDFAQVDAAGWSDADVRQALVHESTRPFDLSNGPLVRARVLTRSAGEHVLLLVVHHIAADLWSL
ncbi:MAG: AMP-binding protein, partial [Myxococcota bacterium]